MEVSRPALDCPGYDRLALGYDQVNLWGGSYGTRLALEVMRRHPVGLRSVVLDSVYPPDVDLYAEAPANFSRALERLFSACAANPICVQAYPNLRFLLPGQIYTASQGDYTAFDRVRGALIGQLGLSSRGMMFSVQCNEELPFSSLESLKLEQGRHPEISALYENALLGELTFRVCEI